MSKRLQVLLEESELREIQRLARSQKLTVAEWVRQALRAARRRCPPGSAAHVSPVEMPAVERAKTIVLGNERLSARDGIHLAVMEAHRIPTIMSFDAGFDGYPGIQRLRA